MRYMKFIRRKIKKMWTFTSVLNFVTGGKNDVKHKEDKRGNLGISCRFQFSCACVCTKLEIIAWNFLSRCNRLARKRFSYVLPANESLPEVRRIANYKEKEKKNNLTSRRYNSTLRFVRQYLARRHNRKSQQGKCPNVIPPHFPGTAGTIKK